ncbi:MAG: sel1 repeat family protein [Lachnospiraceae bacterium]|nr:sel1 repeat family protein [Lachnospiraceae bacterium]
MNRFTCDESYEKDLKEYTGQILEKSGVSSQSAEREIMCMADEGNTVAGKLYADLVFYQKVLRKNPYREAFSLYLRSAGITVDEDGTWHCSGVSYPLSFWTIGYYLVNYRRESILQKCEPIEIIDAMTLPERLSTALELATACITYINASGAINLVGRILREAAADEDLFASLRDVILDTVANRDFPEISLKVTNCDTAAQCSAIAELFFATSAQEGYVYACNNLAAREANRIIRMSKEGKDNEFLKECIMKYVHYLKISADKYESYAANRLGLFYMTGEIKGKEGKMIFREYIDPVLAKEYFTKATVYPDAYSAWSFLNLIKYFHKDYDKNIELLNEHMEYIKELNPEVYDIAMEL